MMVILMQADVNLLEYSDRSAIYIIHQMLNLFEHIILYL